MQYQIKIVKNNNSASVICLKILKTGGRPRNFLMEPFGEKMKMHMRSDIFKQLLFKNASKMLSKMILNFGIYEVQSSPVPKIPYYLTFDPNNCICNKNIYRKKK